MNRENGIAAIILAAGLGTRMKSGKAKVLHSIAGKSMISYVLETALKVTSSENIVVVIGCQAEAVRMEASKKGNVLFAYQHQQLGTGHAVLCALDSVPDDVQEVVVLCGDVPFISHQTIKALVKKQKEDGLTVTVLSVRLDSPTGYGRIVFDNKNNVVKIVEESDASSAEKAIDVVNAGTYCVNKIFLKWALSQIKPDNKQKEFYLTDIVGVASKDKKLVGALILQNANEALGINSLDDLARAEMVLSEKI